MGRKSVCTIAPIEAMSLHDAELLSHAALATSTYMSTQTLHNVDTIVSAWLIGPWVSPLSPSLLRSDSEDLGEKVLFGVPSRVDTTGFTGSSDADLWVSHVVSGYGGP